MGLYMAQAPYPIPSFPLPPPPPPPALKGTSLPMLYYGLIIVGTAAIVLAMYNLLFIKWSPPRHHPPSPPRNATSNSFVEAARSARSRSFENLDSFKYKKQKEGSVAEEQVVGIDYECAVCLSVFEDGEEIRKLPSCKHSFHAPCIDMWLYSHSDCPLCRATVPIVSWCPRELTTTTTMDEHSRELLLVSSSSSSSTSLPV